MVALAPAFAHAQKPAPVWLGISWDAVEFAPAPATGGATDGARVELVVPDSPAGAAGLRPSDVIFTLDGQPLTPDQIWVQHVAASGPKTVTVALLRDGRPLTLDVVLADRPADADALIDMARNTQRQAEQQEADAAEAAHNYRAAFDHAVRVARLNLGASQYADADYDAAVAQLARLLPRLQPPPAVSADVERHSNLALATLQAAKSDDDDDRAAREFGSAIYEGPWIADLYRNQGLILAKAGRAVGAVDDLRRYLVLAPGTRDAAAVKQKLATLEPIAADQRLWQPFLGRMPMRNGDVELATLRNRDFSLTVASAVPGSLHEPGDVVCAGTVSGPRFRGSCNYASRDDAFIACFTRQKRYDADGEIDGNVLTIRSVHHLRFFPDECTITSEDRGTFRTIAARH